MWVNKQVYSANGQATFKVIKGNVDSSKPDAIHQVDGLSGATLTSNGVTNLVQFWMGDLGYKKFLSKVREGGI